MPSVHREVEKKYAVDVEQELPALAELLQGSGRKPGAMHAGVPPLDATRMIVADVEQQRLKATYFDTADLRLAAAGLTLRRRTGGSDAGWHLKVPVAGDERTEIRLAPTRASRTVPASLRQMVLAQTRGEPLVPVARIDTRRTVHRLLDPTRRVLVELADDFVTAERVVPAGEAGGSASAGISWREVEVELVNGDHDILATIDAELRGRGLTVAPSTSKLNHVLSINAADSAMKRGRRLSRKSPAAAVVLAYVSEQVEQLVAQDLAVRLDRPDGVHKMRVATRRIRSALTTFKQLFVTDDVRPLRAELKWLAGILGQARDAEVLRDRINAGIDSEDDTLMDGRVGVEVDAEMSQSYRAARDQVLAELGSLRYQQILAALQALIEHPPTRRRAIDPAANVLPKLVNRSFHEVRDLITKADRHDDGDERDRLLHEARKAAKRARYAGESVRAVFGKDATRFAAAMENLQEALGEHNDSLVTRNRLRELALHTSNQGTAFTCGRLHGLEEAGNERWRAHFSATWKAAGKKSIRRWLR